jgi:hypothetical protein
MAVNGIVLIKPTSVASSYGTASINAGGSVTFSGELSLSLNGVFSSAYDNYIVDMQYTALLDATDVLIRLRSAGTDETGSNYTYQRLIVNGTSVSGSRITTTSGALGLASITARNGIAAHIYGPYLSQPTAARSLDASGLSGAYIRDFAWTHSLSSSYDGITIFFANSSQSIGGRVKVYGLVK